MSRILSITDFWNKSIVSDSGCWEWTAGKDKDGYGKVTINYKSWRAHRYAWFITHGDIEPDLLILHKCDNPKCINPFHLFIGTQKDNRLDAKAKGRTASGDRNGLRLHPESVLRGEKHPSKTKPECVARGDRHSSRTKPEKVSRGSKHGMAILNEELVSEIKQQYLTGAYTQKDLGFKHGVSQGAIHLIVKNKTWKHVK